MPSEEESSRAASAALASIGRIEEDIMLKELELQAIKAEIQNKGQKEDPANGSSMENVDEGMKIEREKNIDMSFRLASQEQISQPPLPPNSGKTICGRRRHESMMTGPCFGRMASPDCASGFTRCGESP